MLKFLSHSLFISF